MRLVTHPIGPPVLVSVQSQHLMTADPAFPTITDPALRWQSLALARPEPPQEWLRWLEAPGSLTELLVKRSQGQFRVRVVDEKWCRLELGSWSRLFGPVAAQHKFWSRQVVLLGRDEPWVLAHTLIPEHAFNSPLREILKLNNKPLGEFLFSHSSLIRSNLDITLWGGANWGRRSLFLLFGKPVLVAEFFLPELVRVPI